MYPHHALLYVGPRDACLALIPDEWRTGIDAHVIAVDQLSIDDARSLRERASSRPIESSRRHFIIAAQALTQEAQNALLKLFEDPPETAQFHLIVPRVSILLPTVRSRLHLHVDMNAHSADEDAARVFLDAPYAERLEQIATLHRAKDSASLRALIEAIEDTIVRTNRVQDGAILKDVLLASRYSDIRGGSPKMLLEHLALSLPRV